MKIDKFVSSMPRSTPNKKTLKRFYEREALAMNHQKLMYSRGEKNEVWWHTKRFSYVIQFIEGTLEDQKTFIDVGCAEGYYMKYTVDRFNKVFCVGADIARSYINKAKRNLGEKNVAFVVCDAESLPFREYSFDVVLCSEVLEHTVNYHKALTELIRVANRCIIISFPGHTFVYRLLARPKLLRQLVHRIMPSVGHLSPVGHLSDIAILHVKSFVETSNEVMPENLLVGGAFPMQLYKLIPSTGLINAIDGVACRILNSLRLTEYTTIRVMKIIKKSIHENHAADYLVDVKQT